MELAGPIPELQLGDQSPDPYLFDFTRLGPQIFFHEPKGSSPSNSEAGTPPDLIILCSWMGAHPRYIAKYTKPYQSMFPHSPILLLKQDGPDLFWKPTFLQRRAIKPALSVIRRVVQSKLPDKPRILLHIFSNGGSYSALFLADAYRTASTNKDEPLPISALILDSTPSLPSSKSAHAAISESLPKSGPMRTVGSAATWAFIGLAKTYETVSGSENITLWLRRKLNEPGSAFTQNGLKRLYIYSQSDALIPAADVESHARESMDIIGRERVQLEDFVSSRHVGHVMLDGQRYWELVENLWKEMTS
ncbi:uncharacterized protein PV06_08633 [Exophiala oligosperma]|uniref:Uncharacterized protein n=2 Tax=Chaetothyriales TaxID=34395 RepID=A0A0D2DT60_9EURO|nr:uncharacterized protein PV06_08633 [Exophiala oligosperma]KAJ9635006.1 hypothetical protein H2204_005961 [Knufia peltigerae]KIW38794.1 hypothetical protein PV06_08633 [Exophiala oligosperma]